MEGRVSKPPVGSVVPLSVWGPGPGDWAHGGDAPPESLARPPSTIIRERHGGAKYRCPSGPSQYWVSRRRSHHVGNTGRNHFQRHCDLSFPPSPDSTLGVDGLGGAFGVEPQLRGHRGRWQTWTRHRPRGRADARAAFLPPLTLGPFRPSHRLGADLRFPGKRRYLHADRSNISSRILAGKPRAREGRARVPRAAAGRSPIPTLPMWRWRLSPPAYLGRCDSRLLPAEEERRGARARQISARAGFSVGRMRRCRDGHSSLSGERLDLLGPGCEGL